jgi:hypothetical protein
MNFTSTATAFQAKINTLAAVAGMTGAEVYELWRKYDRQCTMYDQSPVLFEFVQWYTAELGGNQRALMDALDQVEAAL